MIDSNLDTKHSGVLMSEFNLSYPLTGNSQESQIIKSGEILFLTGANGKGKSMLMHHFSVQNQGKVRRITAHRQVWFNSNSIDLTPASREQSEQNMMSQDIQAHARYRDDHAIQRSQVTLFDLIDAQNIEARKIVEILRSGNLENAQILANSKSPIAKMNDILKISNLDIQIQVEKGSKLLAVRDDNPPYSIAELSDGERNALLIVASVLTAPPNTLILLDEPERHLHRSIVSPLLSTLLTYREDCAFVISTHDVLLPLDQNKAAALLVREYNHNPQSWTIDYIPIVKEMDEPTAEAVLGSRRKILFIEGSASSLDLKIYQILYPNLSIHPAGSCVEVERIVKGLNSSKKQHWLSAIGIIDRDNRGETECNNLISQGIIPIDLYSVESLYYHPNVIHAMLQRVAIISDINPDDTFLSLKLAILDAFKPHIDRMAAKLVERAVRDKLLHQLPTWRAIQAGNCEITCSTQELFQKEKELISSLIEKQDITTIISRYPIRETPVLKYISTTLDFSSHEKYEHAVRVMLIDSEDEKIKVLNLLNPVSLYINALSV